MPRKKQVTTDGHETNEQFIARLVNSPDPIMQIFVVEAMRRYAEQCANAEAAKLDTGPISGHAWKRCAIKLREAINKHLGE